MLTNFVCTATTTLVVDAAATNATQRFYKLEAFSVYAAGAEFNLRAAKSTQTGAVDVILNGMVGLNYRVDVSTNLVNWVPLTNFVSTNAVMTFRDSSATNSKQRFYRGVLP